MGSNRNVNVKEASKRSYVNVKARGENFNCGKGCGKISGRILRSQRIADDLTRKFGPVAKNSYAYLCKCAYRLSEHQIWSIYEKSLDRHITNKWAYFLATTKAQPEMQ